MLNERDKWEEFLVLADRCWDEDRPLEAKCVAKELNISIDRARFYLRELEEVDGDRWTIDAIVWRQP